MPSVGVKIYSVFFKCSCASASSRSPSPAGTGAGATRPPSGFPPEATAPANPAFSAADGVASKDLHIDPNSALSIRIFLPTPPRHPRRPSDPAAGAAGAPYRGYLPHAVSSPRAAVSARRRLPIVVQFHGGGFVTGSNCSASNDAFCRRVAKFFNTIVPCFLTSPPGLPLFLSPLLPAKSCCTGHMARRRRP